MSFNMTYDGSKKRMRRIYKIMTVFIFLFLLTGSVVKVDAAEKEYVHKENFSDDYKLQGLFATCYQSFQTGNWDVREARLTLYYTSTMLVREEISDFTISVNGRPVYSEKIEVTSGEIQKVTIPIPVDCIQEGFNQISIQSYIRTNEEDPCKDDVTEASWMMILKESQISVHYTPAVDCRGIADLYAQLSSIEGLENGESTIVIPSGADGGELTAAALALSGLSSNAPLSYQEMGLRTIMAGSAMPENKYILYISSLDNCLPEVLAAMNDGQMEAAQNDAVMLYLKGSKGQNILAVTGGTSEALENACRLLGNSGLMKQSKGIFRKITAGENVAVPKEEKTENRLTETGSYVSGPFKQTASFYIEQAANNKIAAGSRVKLKFRYAQNLDFSRSLVTIYLGETPLGSKKLSKDGADGDSLTVDIPENLQLTGPFNLNVTFDLEIQDMECTMRRQDMPWAYVTNDSMIFLQTKEVPYLLFDYFPSPFISNGRFNQLTVILPSEESEDDLEAFASVMRTLGRYQTDNTGDIRVCRADKPGDLTNTNIISIGEFQKNPIVRQLNDRLYFKFSTDGAIILSNEKKQIESVYGQTLGTSQLLYSPFSTEKYGLLLITGVTRQGMKQASEYFNSIENTYQLYGDGFVADQENVYCFRFGEDNSLRVSLADKLTSHGDLLGLMLAGACMLLLMLFAYLMFMKKMNRRNNAHKKNRSENE